ncbi:MAG: PH domain-containing protein [Planctomycetota bacterium]
MRFRSKIDLWLAALLATSPVMAMLGAYILVLQRDIVANSLASGGWFWFIVIGTLALGVGLPVWFLLSTHYELSDSVLIVKGGPFRWKIPVHDITNVTPTHSPLSSPALSLDRLRIDYAQGTKSLMISPRDKDQFLKALEEARRAP